MEPTQERGTRGDAQDARRLGVPVPALAGRRHHVQPAHARRRFTIPTPALLSKVVDMLDDIPMADGEIAKGLAELKAMQA